MIAVLLMKIEDCLENGRSCTSKTSWGWGGGGTPWLLATSPATNNKYPATWNLSDNPEFLWSSPLSGPRDHYSPLSRPLGVLRISSDVDVWWWKDCFGFENFDSGILIFMGRKIWQLFFGGWLDLSRDFWELVFALIRQSPSIKIPSTTLPLGSRMVNNL